jgi:hypothetical protein
MQAIPLGLMVLGSVVKGVAGFQAGKANRSIASANARTTLEEGNAQAIRIRNLSRIQLGRQIGAQAESGFQIGTGSAIDSLVESQTSAELDAMDAMRQAKSRANAYQAQGNAAYQEGKFALASGFIGAASSVASAGQDYATAKGGG